MAFDRDTGSPLAGAEVTVAGLTVLAETDGIYRFPSVPQGTHEIIATRSGYLGAIGALFVSSADRVFSVGMFFAHCFEANWFEGVWQDDELPQPNDFCFSTIIKELVCDCSNDPCIFPRDRIQCRLLQKNDRQYCVDYDVESRTFTHSSAHCDIEVGFSRGGSAVIRWRNTVTNDTGQYWGEQRVSPVPANIDQDCN